MRKCPRRDWESRLTRNLIWRRDNEKMKQKTSYFLFRMICNISVACRNSIANHVFILQYEGNFSKIARKDLNRDLYELRNCIVFFLENTWKTFWFFHPSGPAIWCFKMIKNLALISLTSLILYMYSSKKIIFVCYIYQLLTNLCDL